MKIITVETKDLLEELIDAWAMTWEGLSEESFERALELCCKDGKDGTGYVISGKDMNELCEITKDCYPDDLTIFMIKDFKGLAMQFGARWLADIYMNNAAHEDNYAFGMKW